MRVAQHVMRVGLAAIVLAATTHVATAATKEDKVFTVGNYPVEARAADAVAAKTRAIAEGQQAAFRSLLRRIVPVTAYNRLPRLKATPAANLIEGIAVRSERNSATDYIASYDFAFNAEAVRRILDREGIPFLDRQAPKITLVPIYRAPTGGDVPETFTDSRGSDAWLYAWKSLDLANTLSPIDLKPAHREVHADTIKALADGDFSHLRTLGSEYGTESIVIAILEPDLAQKKIRVTLAGRDAVAPFTLRRTYRLDGIDLAYTAELAAVIGLGVLEGRWKAINVRGTVTSTSAGTSSMQMSGPEAVARPEPVARPGTAPAPVAGPDGQMRIAVEFQSMAEWQLISRTLSETPDIADLDVEGLSARGARIKLSYPAGPQQLAVNLAAQGLILRNAGGTWVLGARR